MQHNITRLAILLLTLSFIVGHAPVAQSMGRPEIDWTPDDYFAGDGGDGYLLAVESSGLIKWKALGSPPNYAVSTFTQPCEARMIGQSHFVIAWWNNALPILEYWEIGSLGLTPFASTPWIGASDLLSLAFDNFHSILYRFDFSSGELDYLEWNGTGSAIAANWNRVDLSGHPHYASAGNFFSWITAPSLPSGGYMFLGEAPGELTRFGLAIVGHPSLRHFSFLNLHRSFSFHDYPVFDGPTITEGALSVQVIGSPGRTVEVRNADTGAVLGSALIAGPGYTAQVPLSAPLLLGAKYSTRFTGAAGWSWPVACLRRYSSTAVAPSGLRFLPILQVAGAYAGNSSFQFTTELQMTPEPSHSVSLTGVALAGIAPGSQNPALDPIINSSGQWLIDPATAILGPMVGSIDQDGFGMLTWALPIPNDPILVGQIVLLQAAVNDGSGLIVSDIIGVTVTAAP